MGAITLFPGKGKCGVCGGSGRISAGVGKHKLCRACRGTGKIIQKSKKQATKNKVCDRCHGTGIASNKEEYGPTKRVFTRLSLPDRDRSEKIYVPHKFTCTECGGSGKL